MEWILLGVIAICVITIWINVWFDRMWWFGYPGFIPPQAEGRNPEGITKESHSPLYKKQYQTLIYIRINKPFYLVLIGFPHILDSFPQVFIQVWEVWRFGYIRVWRFGRVSERVVWRLGITTALDTGVLLPIYKPKNLQTIYLFHISKILLWKNLCITYPD